VIMLRPDRFVAGMSLAYDLSRLTKAFAAHLHALEEPSERRADALRNGGVAGDRKERLEKS
jgi:hypothetical protein